jgi:ribosomal protein S6--L-glutamate ligase
MEVNSSPGLEGIETCTQLDIAGAIVDYIAAQVDFPEIDVRQRLTVSKGYGVNEIYVPEGSDFVGKKLSDIDLSERDLNVLTLYRGNKVIPNPRSDRVLEPGDKLLCFGKLESMRGLVPRKTQRRRQPAVKDLPETEVTVEAQENLREEG